jgi:single-stranded DNA-binding protein
MSKKNDYALVSLLGTVVWSDVVRYDENKKELHNYFVQVTEKYNDKERKYSFKATQFGLKRNSYIYKKGDRVKIKGFLKVNSYQNDAGEWINQTYVSINKIEDVDDVE